jgi:hypothetical protein
MPPLFSGNWRHRRPRQAPSFIVTAGVAGAGIAIPLFGAGVASAADAGTWDRVAECESGGLWSADEDNGFYGGLQLDQETWEEYGGTELAERPDLASRGQQIDVAERILEAEGPDAWSDCADSAGLSKDSADTSAPETDGSGSESEEPAAESPYPSSPSETAPGNDGSGSGDSGDEDLGGLPDHATPPGASESADPSDSADSGDSGDSGTGADEEYPDESTDPGGDSGEDVGSGRGDSDDHPSREDAPRGDAGSPGDSHRVSGGESLSGIAEKYDVRGGWTELYERNRDVIGSDPCLILPGQELKL